MAKIPNRPTRRTVDGKIVGSPTNDGVMLLNEASLVRYKNDLERQISSEREPNEKHEAALKKSLEKLDHEIIVRELLRR